MNTLSFALFLVEFQFWCLSNVKSLKEVYLSNDKFVLPSNSKNYITNSQLTFYHTDIKVDFTYDEIWGIPQIDSNKFAFIHLAKTIAQEGTDKYHFKALKKDGRELELGKDYYINYTLSDTAITFQASSDEVNRDSYYEQNSPSNYNWIAECLYQSDISKFQLSYQMGNDRLKRIVSWEGLAFAIYKDFRGVQVLEYSNLQPSTRPLSDFTKEITFKNNQYFTDIFLINQENLDYVILVLLTNTDTTMLKIISAENGVDTKFQLFTTIKNSVFFSPQNTTGFGIIDNNVIISSLDYGMQVLQNPDLLKTTSDTNNWKLYGMLTYYELKDGKRNTLQVKDFVILNKTLYVLVQGYGLKFYGTTFITTSDLTSKSFTDTQMENPDFRKTSIPQCFKDNLFNFEHPNLKAIDYHINPITNNKFIGLLINSEANALEFFIELIAFDDNKPFINKVFYAPNPIKADSFVTDRFFSFVLDKNKKNLVVFRRGLLNPIHELSYVIPFPVPLDIDETTFTPIVLVYDFKNQKMGISFLTKNFGLIYLNNFEFFEDQLICKFNSDGIFQLSFHSQAEICEHFDDKNGYCEMQLITSFNVIAKVVPYTRTLSIILGVLCSIISIGVVVAIIRITRCCYRVSEAKKAVVEVDPQVKGYGSGIQGKSFDVSKLSQDVSKLSFSLDAPGSPSKSESQLERVPDLNKSESIWQNNPPKKNPAQSLPESPESRMKVLN